MNVLRDLTISFAFRIKLIAFSGFQKTQVFFLKNQSFFQEENNFQRFEKSYYFSFIQQQNFYFLAISTKSKFFFEKPIYFLYYNQILKVSRSLTFSVASYNKFLTLAISTKSIFFRKTHIFFLIKSNFEGFEKSYFFSRTLSQVLYIQHFFLEKSNFSSQKIHHIVPSKNLKFEHFEIFHFLKAIVEQICYF